MLKNFRSVMKNPLFYYTCSSVTCACAADGPLTKCHSAVINSPESYSGGRKFNSSTYMLGQYLKIDHTCLFLHSFQFIVQSHPLT